MDGLLHDEVESGHYPDGLTESVIDLLIEQAYDEIAGLSPSKAGRATARRRRRFERRAVGAIVRELPMRFDEASGPDGQAA